MNHESGRRLEFLLLGFLLFLLQFVYFPIGRSFFEGAKVYTAEILIFVLLLMQLFSKEGIQLQNYKKSALWCAGILFTLTLYHLLFHYTQTLLFGNAFRLQGTFLLWMLVLFGFLSSRISIEEKIKPIFIFFVLFVQLICTLLFIGIGTDRPVGTLGEPNALAASVLFLWPFLVVPWPNTRSMKVAAGAGLVCTLIILFLSGSRSGVIALAIQVSFIGSFLLLDSRLHGNDKMRNALTYSVLIALFLMFLSYATPFIGPRTEYEDRGEIWKSAMSAAMKQPIAGVGFGNAEYALHAANVQNNNKLIGYYVDSAHNIFLDWFIQAGIIGLGVLLFLLYETITTFISQKNTRNIVLLLGLITALSFNPASVVSFIALWWLIGKGMDTKFSTT